MAVNLTAGGVGALVGIIVIGGAAYWLYSKRGTVGKAISYINPLDRNNLATQLVDEATRTITGDKTQTFGGKLYDLTTPPINMRPIPTENPNYYSKAGSNASQRPLTNDEIAHMATLPVFDIGKWYTDLTNKVGGIAYDVLHDVPRRHGWHPALDGDTGRMTLVPPLTPATWGLIAGVSLGLYLYNGKKRRRGRRR